MTVSLEMIVSVRALRAKPKHTYKHANRLSVNRLHAVLLPRLDKRLASSPFLVGLIQQSAVLAHGRRCYTDPSVNDLSVESVVQR